LRELEVGDVVRVLNYLGGRMGIIIKSGNGPWKAWKLVELDAGEKLWWQEAHLEYVGNEQSLACQILGENYFA
jgi:hypothetical protein